MIAAESLEAIGHWLHDQALDESITGQLRERFPGLHFTFCMDDDVTTDSPVYENERFNLYLVDSSNHCLSFTTDLEVATGLVVAEIEDE